MTALGEFLPPEGAGRWAALAAWVVALALAALVQRWQLRLRRAEGTRWWASNGRDVLNAGALAALTGSLALLGFAWPMALVLGSTVLLLFTLAAAWPRGLAAVAVLLGGPIAAAPGRVHAIGVSVASYLAG